MLNTLLTHLNSGAAIVVVLGLCLLCHEAGHFVVAKLCGMRVEEFAFGFGRALFQRRRGETNYRLNLFPVGGYVKIAGMEPGAVGVERGFHTRPRWQGALVIIAGSVANIILAVALFTVVTLWQGLPKPGDEGIYIAKVAADSPAQAAGLRPRDRIVAVDGQRQALELTAVSPGPAQAAGLKKNAIIERIGGVEVNTPIEMLAALRAARGQTVSALVLDPDAKSLATQEQKLNLPVPPAVRQSASADAAQVLEEAYALQFAPLSQGALVGYIAARPRQTVGLTVERRGQMVQAQATTETGHGRYTARDEKGMLYSRIREIGRIGVVLRGATRPATIHEALQAGVIRTIGSAATVVLSVQAMVRREVEPELAGPVAIMAISAERARIGWDAVLGWGGIISSILAVMNLFPFPPFDGFRVALLGFEGIVRRRVDARVELVVSVAGFIFVMFLFVALTAKDVTNLVRYGTP
jgi:regulator of sigma E protease